MDVWGTWCGSCKATLSKSKEEFERLAPYDVAFLYLADHSDEKSRQNVIKEYDVTGDNVVHYNLPDKQQTAVEQYLGVRGYPTYRLVDGDGRLLDVDADPRNLDALESIINSIKKINSDEKPYFNPCRSLDGSHSRRGTKNKSF